MANQKPIRYWSLPGLRVLFRIIDQQSNDITENLHYLASSDPKDEVESRGSESHKNDNIQCYVIAKSENWISTEAADVVIRQANNYTQVLMMHILLFNITEPVTYYVHIL